MSTTETKLQVKTGQVKTDQVNNDPVPVKTEHVVAEEMVREPTKKCCTTMSKDMRIACHCCRKTWSCCLNSCEGCCFVLSKCCLFSSDMALGCNKCLEQIDCD